jgi:hypothetical protein
MLALILGAFLPFVTVPHQTCEPVRLLVRRLDGVPILMSVVLLRQRA